MKKEPYLWLAVAFAIAVAIGLLGVLRSTWGRPALADTSKARGLRPTAALDTATPLLPVKGTQSCSNRGCHGAIEPALDGREPDKVWQNEYAQWAFDEKHANAYQTLLNEKSQNIARLLGGKLPAHEDPRCLACHTNPHVADLPKDHFFGQDEKVFGVGCESCHGSANKWLVAHTRKDWRAKSSDEKQALGMVPVADPYRRTEACAGCHVGGPKANGLPARDMNHDMIAAGHPRLNFEMSAFQANMPPHWRPYGQRGPSEKQTPPAKMWAIGQIASAQAALDLLIHRANQPATWPEFAEYDCYACHHSFAEPSWRVQAERGKRKPGAVPWGSWYFAMARPFSADPALAALDDEMRIKPRLPHAKEAIKKAEKARAALGKLATTLEKEKDDLIRKRIWNLIDARPPTVGESWDSAEQLYLAAHAVSAAKVPGAFNDVTPMTPPRKLFELLQKLPR